MKLYRHTQGFTLVELSIVLLVIGLIAGGVMVGSSLLEAAKVRSTITDIAVLRDTSKLFNDKGAVVDN